MSLRERVAPWLLAIVPVLCLFEAVRGVVHSYSATPYQDQWDNIFWWREILKIHAIPKGYLLLPHNEHRILLPRLVFMSDIKWFQARDILNLATIGAIQIAGAACFATMALRRRLTVLGALGLAFAAGVTVSLVQWGNLFWGFQVQFVGVFVAAAWALYLHARATETPGRLSWPQLAGALALLVAATLTMSNGLLAGVAMLLVSLVTRRGWRAALIPLVVTAVLIGLYFLDFQSTTPGGLDPDLAAHHPVRYAQYVAAYLGSLFAFGHPLMAVAAGVVGALATVAMVWVLWRTRERDAARTALLGVALFVGMSAGITGVGRLQYGIEQALSARYVTPSCWFWAAQALFWSLTVQHRPWRRPEVVLVAASVVAAILALIPLQSRGERELMAMHERILEATAALEVGVEDQEAFTFLYPDIERVHDLTPFLKAQSLAGLADEPGYQVGARLQTAALATDCQGAFDAIVPAPSGSTWRVSGWAWDKAAKRRVWRLILADDTGTVVGRALGGVERRDITKHVGEVRSPVTGWTGAADRGAGREVTAYAMLANGRLCKVATKAWPAGA